MVGLDFTNLYKGFEEQAATCHRFSSDSEQTGHNKLFILRYLFLKLHFMSSIPSRALKTILAIGCNFVT